MSITLSRDRLNDLAQQDRRSRGTYIPTAPALAGLFRTSRLTFEDSPVKVMRRPAGLLEWAERVSGGRWKRAGRVRSAA